MIVCPSELGMIIVGICVVTVSPGGGYLLGRPLPRLTVILQDNTYRPDHTMLYTYHIE